MKEIVLRKKRASIIISELKRLYPTTQSALQYATPFEFLVAVILSAQCTDARVNIVTATLFKKYRSVQAYAEADIREFEQDIKPTGFYRNKAKNIVATANIIHDTYHDILPQTMEELLTLPGVARKTANVVLGGIYGIASGIAVDTHVRRLSNVYGLTTSQNPEIIERDLVEVISKGEWIEFTLRMIDYGREYCPAKKHDHENCPLFIALKEQQLLPEVQHR